MNLLSRYFAILVRILTSKFAFSRMRLFWCYSTLIFKAVIHHKFKRQSASSADIVREEAVMGFSVRFFDYIQLITLFEEIFVFEVYKFSATSDRPFIIDCGSNIGLSVLYFKALYPASRIMAFEPDPQAFELLVSNIRNNKVGHVICYNEAVTNNVGVAELFKGEIPGSLGMSLIEMPTTFRQTVHTVRLSEFIHNDVDLLKIDVEGSEIQIIEDLLETGTIQFVKQMVIEFHPSKITRDIQDFLDALTNCGFDFYERNEAFPESSDRLFYFGKKYI